MATTDGCCFIVAVVHASQVAGRRAVPTAACSWVPPMASAILALPSVLSYACVSSESVVGAQGVPRSFRGCKTPSVTQCSRCFPIIRRLRTLLEGFILNCLLLSISPEISLSWGRQYMFVWPKHGQRRVA